jgi:hypothetical protein
VKTFGIYTEYKETNRYVPLRVDSCDNSK